MSGLFTDTHQERLAAFTHMSVEAGNRSDYVQGGGGNTSCKLDDQWMAIKASGFRLNQITPGNAYAVLNYAALREFYGNTDPATLEDIEKTGSARAKAATQEIEGLPVLRPSVEAGFHSMLDTFVLHSHSVYANLIACTTQGRELAAKVMASLGRSYAYVPYINPGAQLTFEIARARAQAASPDGSLPQVIFMENHGLIATADDADVCLEIHETVNLGIQRFFDLEQDAWPEVRIAPADDSGNLFRSATTALQKDLRRCNWTLDQLMTDALYPDQLVFLAGQLCEHETGTADAWLAAGKPGSEKAHLFRETGEVVYQCGEPEALTMEQTLMAIRFIYTHVRSNGYDIQVLSEAGKDFISNWESEAYRKTIASK